MKKVLRRHWDHKCIRKLMLAIRVMSTIPCTRGGLISAVRFDIMRNVWLEATKPKKNLQTKQKPTRKKKKSVKFQND